MKRQGGNISDQPPAKKSDVGGSTDLRSKIGAKLQTLLNGISPESRLYARTKRLLYKDLFSEPQHTPIIIDPTIIIKSEPEDEEESSNSSNISTTQNFLISAKNRLNELLSKQQDVSKRFKENEKENTRHKCNSSSGKSSAFQSQALQKLQPQSSDPLSKNRKNISRKGCLKSSQVTSSQVPLKNLVVVVEDIMKSKSHKKFTHLLPSRHTVSYGLNEKKDGPVSSRGNKVTKSFTSNSQTGLFGDSHSICTTDTDSDCCVIENSSNSDVMSPNIDSTFTNNYNYQDMDESSTPFNTGDSINRYHFIHEDDSELIDDPCVPQVIVDVKEGEVVTTESTDLLNLETDVVLLCERTPTHEVITLEDDDESEEIIEETHNCDQCGKKFRLKSLLDFHLKMHKSDLLALAKKSSSSS